MAMRWSAIIMVGICSPLMFGEFEIPFWSGDTQGTINTVMTKLMNHSKGIEGPSRGAANAPIEYRPCRACMGARKSRSLCRDMVLGPRGVFPTNATVLRDLMVAAWGCHPVCDPRKQCRIVAFQRPRPDDAAPPVLRRSSTVAVLPSMETASHLPNQGNATENALTTFAVYNPSIIAIPLATRISLESQGRRLPNEKPTYLASFRVSTVSACLPAPRKVQNLLGLAILNDAFDILVEVVVDANQAELWQHTKTSRKPRGLFMEDFRLFYWNETVFVSHASSLLPIQVLATQPGSSTNTSASGTVVLPNIFGSQLQIAIASGYPARSVQLGPSEEPRKGKNFQFFSINNDGSSEIWMENWPGPHFTTKIEQMSGGDFNLTQAEFSHEDLPPSSFVVEDLFAPLGMALTKDRGSACCVDLDASYIPSESQYANSSLLVGISHVKNKDKIESDSGTTNGYIYMSRFYAFEPIAPFHIVAQSGLFCLGDGTSEMTANGTVYKCPQIHFVSSMTVSPSNESRLAIGYGVNDCTAHFIEVEKLAVAKMLFEDIDVLSTLTEA